MCYLGKLDGKDLLVLEVHEEAVHQQLVVDVPGSCRHRAILHHSAAQLGGAQVTVPPAL